MPSAGRRPATLTPSQRVLLHDAEVAVESERLLFETERAAHMHQLAHLERQLTLQRDNIDRAEIKVERLELDRDAPGLDRRRTGEAGAPVPLVRERRWSENARLRTAAETELGRYRDAYAAAELERSRLRSAVERLLAVRRSRVARIQRHAERRLAGYRRALVRRHASGAEVDDALTDPRLDLPTWTASPWQGEEDA